MPLVVGLAPEDERTNILNALVEDIRAHDNSCHRAGDIGFHYVVDASASIAWPPDVLWRRKLERTDTPSYGYQLCVRARPR